VDFSAGTSILFDARSSRLKVPRKKARAIGSVTCRRVGMASSLKDASSGSSIISAGRMGNAGRPRRRPAGSGSFIPRIEP
jgi:hypothetical protein